MHVHVANDYLCGFDVYKYIVQLMHLQNTVVYYLLEATSALHAFIQTTISQRP